MRMYVSISFNHNVNIRKCQQISTLHFMAKLYICKFVKSTPKFDHLLPKFAPIRARNVIYKDRNGYTKPKKT